MKVEELDPTRAYIPTDFFEGLNAILAAYPDNKDHLTFESVLGFNDELMGNCWASQYEDYYLYKAIDPDNKFQTDNLVNTCAAKIKFVLAMNHTKYIAMLRSVAIDYNPINNYDMVENYIGSTKDSDITTTTTGNVTDTNNYNNFTTQVENFTYPYDSNGVQGNATKDTSSLTTPSGTTTTTKDYGAGLQVKETHDINQTTNQKIDDVELKGNHTDDHVLTRKGNIGVTTTQQLLESEIALKSRNIVDEFFNDINEQILLSVFL